jgi:hypothetical protein
MATHRFPEEDYVGLDEAFTSIAARDVFSQDMFFHAFVVVRRLAINAALGGKASMSLDDFVIRNACSALECVDVLRKALV